MFFEILRPVTFSSQRYYRLLLFLYRWLLFRCRSDLVEIQPSLSLLSNKPYKGLATLCRDDVLSWLEKRLSLFLFEFRGSMGCWSEIIDDVVHEAEHDLILFLFVVFVLKLVFRLRVIGFKEVVQLLEGQLTRFVLARLLVTSV
jgi:hypothetical protein